MGTYRLETDKKTDIPRFALKNTKRGSLSCFNTMVYHELVSGVVPL
uniref:Uncharacterized protein n=1 Tax=Staphylococcus pseudintermedius TaxID=283734 RepID=A0A0N7FVR9_STAPS|nr:hypothetical protein SP547_pKM00140 [Staphylococcus pseudintermedius]